MVLCVFKWNIHPDKTEAYLNFAQQAVPDTVSVRRWPIAWRSSSSR